MLYIEGIIFLEKDNVKISFKENLFIIEEERECLIYIARVIESGSPEDRIIFYEGVVHYDWLLIVNYNEIITKIDEIANIIEGQGFNIESTSILTRVGKNIIIPPDGN